MNTMSLANRCMVSLSIAKALLPATGLATRVGAAAALEMIAKSATAEMRVLNIFIAVGSKQYSRDRALPSMTRSAVNRVARRFLAEFFLIQSLSLQICQFGTIEVSGEASTARFVLRSIFT